VSIPQIFVLAIYFVTDRYFVIKTYCKIPIYSLIISNRRKDQLNKHDASKSLYLVMADSALSFEPQMWFLLVWTLLQIVGVIVIYSRIAEVEYEIKYGEKKDLSQWASRANLLDRSGANTPSARTPGTRTPAGNA